MTYKELLKSEGLLYIDLSVLEALFPKESYENLKIRVSQLSRSGKLIRIKRGMYVLDQNFQSYKNYPEYLAVIACLIKPPAYLSLDYVLRKYNVLTEATYGYTLITTKKRALITSKLGSFRFYEMSKSLFTGYNSYKFLDYEYYEATKAKALFDWLYYRTGTIMIDKPGINLVEDLRLNLESFTKEDFLELQSYTKLGRPQKALIKIIENICNHAHD